MSKRLNYYQVHKNKTKRKRLPYKQPTQEQLDACYEYFRKELNEMLTSNCIFYASI